MEELDKKEQRDGRRWRRMCLEGTTLYGYWLKMEKTCWRQKLKMNWLKEVTMIRNTSAKWSLCAKQNYINRLMVDGEKVSDPKRMANHVKGFFKNLSAKSCSQRLVLGCIPCRRIQGDQKD